LNVGGKDFCEGTEVGKLLRGTHRTLQRLAICYSLGVIIGLSDQQFTDARNEVSIKTAKKIARLFEEGELPLGLYI
jgi:hypothetical protein